MGMDRNTVIGFVLIGILLVVMLGINSKNRLEFEAGQKKLQDSIANVQRKKAIKDSIEAISLQKVDTATLSPIPTPLPFSNFPSIKGAQENLITVENDAIKVVFSNFGGQPKSVTLKNFKKYNGQPVILNNGAYNQLNYRFNSSSEKSSLVGEIAFNPGILTIDPTTQSKKIEFTVGADSIGKKIVHSFVIPAQGFMIDFNMNFTGADKLFTQQLMNIDWQSECPTIEKDHAYELTQSHFCFYENEDGYDFEYIAQPDKKELGSTNWIATKQQFFLTALIAKNNFKSVATSWVLPSDSTQNYLYRTATNAQVNLSSSSSVAVPLQLYYGPSDYNVLTSYGNHLGNIVPYGSGIFAFVKYINRYFLLPVFDFLQHNIASMGIVILLLTLLIRLITSPILYKSYLSGAKMKVLKPEVDALKEKYKDDQQTFGMEQMKLWRSAGVNPLGGCLPALLQIPIFMSLYYFFQSNIDLRGKSFLWANDLAQYDSIAQLPFSIPFYGDHVSLFTLTAVVTSLLISIYSMSNMQDNSNPVMKYMPYIFPVMLLGIFNKLPAALTWYYTISNTITLILQLVIQKYIINHDKILAQMAENRKKPAKKSKWQERIDAMQESQKKLQEMKNKNSGKS